MSAARWSAALWADRVRCSFCGKGKADVAKLITGPAVYICNECVGACNEILREDAVSSFGPCVECGGGGPVIVYFDACAVCKTCYARRPEWWDELASKALRDGFDPAATFRQLAAEWSRKP